jgi:glycosyltransferase involved in cell wall biosynthesis
LKSVVILYTELASYTLDCLNQFAIDNHIHVNIFHYPINKEAPFKFKNENDLIKLHPRKSFSLKEMKEMIDFINPSLIYCSGWIDKEYLDIVKDYKRKIPTVVGFDNHWVGNLKQRASLFFAKALVSPLFDYAFIPGKPQIQFAKKIGFKDSQIVHGVYSADTEHFNLLYQKNLNQKQKQFPKRFIFVGRYVKEKGIKTLWEAFIKFKEATNNDWELWCLGVGSIAPVEHPSIKHFGFVQPKEMEKFIEESGVFVLPSIFEPWGVVVHEFAAAGFPLILSEAVGAASQFLENGKNGLIFKSGDVNALKEHFITISKMSDAGLNNWSVQSNKTAQLVSPKTFASELYKMMK